MNTQNHKRHQLGVTLIEVLITIVVSAFGLLGMAGLIAKTTATGVDANSRARAVVFMQDITGRIENTRKGDWATASGQVYGDVVRTTCPAATTALGQACEWGNLLAGSKDGGNGAFPFRGCLTSSDAGAAVTVTIAWGSPSKSIAPVDAGACGQGDVSTDDTQRRTITSVVQLPVLSSAGLATVAETP